MPCQKTHIPTLRRYAFICLVWLSMTMPGCKASEVRNPTFDLSVSRAKEELRQMRRQPVTLARPVVVIGGWGDVMGVAPTYIAEQLRKATGDDRIIAVPGGVGVTFDDCRQLVLDRLEKANPSQDPGWTTEVDVIGFSMGGITARYAAMQPQPDNDCPRLRIARLFTVGTPHRGASLAADKKVLDPLSRDMQPDCTFIERLNEQRARETYPIIAYVRLNDTTVGEANAAPPGVTPHWLSAEPFTRSHGGGYHDPRIIADIARRLRGETPYATEPGAPLPE